MCKFNHPNIVRVIGVVLHPRPVVVMEYCQRGNLLTMLTAECMHVCVCMCVCVCVCVCFLLL